MKSWLCAVLAVWVAVVGREASAAITIQDGIPWVYEGMGSGGVRILHGPGCGDVTIPAELDCYPVRGISSKAFASFTGLTSVTLPNSVTSIGSSAFSGCTGLKTLCVPLSMAGTSDVGNSDVPSSCAVLYGDAWEEVEGQAWSYVVEGGKAIVMAGPRQGNVSIPAVLGGHPVTGIGSNAFRNCTSLTSVTIPDSVTDIGGYAFYDCSGLTAADLGSGVTNIGEYVFIGCINLTSVTIPDSVASIGDGAFWGCSALTTVDIGNGVRSIGSDAFIGCTNLKVATIHNLKAWCEINFEDWSANPLYYAQHLYLNGEEVAGDLVIPDGTKTIGIYAFHCCTNLTSVAIPDSVASIGDAAFRNCNALTTVDIGNGVTHIGEWAFFNCINLTAVTIHDVKAWCEINFDSWSDNNPLYYAKHLYLNGEEVAGDLAIPDGTKSIGIYAFYYCTNLTSVVIPDSVTSIGYYAFYNCSGMTNVDIGNGVTNIESYAFSGCSDLMAVYIGNGVTSINATMFTDCNSLTTLAIGNGVTNIGPYAFSSFTNLTTMTLGSSITCIGTQAFFRCSSLTSATIPDSVTLIEELAFYGCSGLTAVDIGSGVTRIGRQTFSFCDRLAAVYIHDLKAWCEIDFDDEFGNPLVEARHLYLDGQEVAGDLVIPNRTKTIGIYAFYYCTNLTSVAIPVSVTNIGRAAFSGCYGLTSVTIPNSVTSIGSMAFNDCNGLKTLYVPASWEGTDMLAIADVPEGCTVIYGTSPEPSAEARYAAWLESLGKTAAELPMGVDSDDDGMSNWEECVAGTNPLDAEDRFEARIRKVDGKIVVDSSAENTGRVYRVHGTTDLAGDEGGEPVWNDVTDEEDLSRTDCRYFKMEARFAD